MKKNNKDSQFEFRIVTGELKGKLIHAPKIAETRPPLTRLRKSIFDFLNPYLNGAMYLDLFAGTGSYLFEAVSRGVIQAVGIELNNLLVDSINNQARQYNVDDRLICFVENAFDAIPRFQEDRRQFDIIMIAPPQYQGIIDQTLTALDQKKIFTDDCLILCQHDTSETPKIDFGLFDIFQQRKYGNTTYTILKKMMSPPH